MPKTTTPATQPDTSAAAPSVTLYRFEFVNSGLGVYDAAWFGTREEARTERRRMMKEDGYYRPADGYLTGQDHEIGDVETVEVPLTAAGVLAFAQNYAVDTNC